MKRITAALLLGTMLVSGTMFNGGAWAQSADDPYPFCQALALPPPQPDPPAPQVAAAAPPVTGASAPAASGQAPVAASAASGTVAVPAPTPQAATAPAAPPAPPPPPTISDLLKSTTDVNQVVDKLLDAYAPFKDGDYDTVFQGMVYRAIADNYVDESKADSLSALTAKYVGKIKSREDLDRAIYDLVQAIGDPGTTYLSAPDQLTLELRASVLKVAFFGARLQAQADGTFTIASLVPGSTADLNGFRVGDTIVSINDKPLKGLNTNLAEGLEFNPAGNQLTVISLQDGHTVDRMYMLQQTVPYKPSIQLLPEQIGYVKFPTQIPDQMMDAVVQNLIKLQVTSSGGMAGIVLDLRYVSAASVSGIKALLPVLIENGVVLHEQVRKGRSMTTSTDSILPIPDSVKKTLTAEQLEVFHDLATVPLVVLVNASTTAVGAEQLAVALREGRPNTTIVGEYLRGNGVESTTLQLPNCGTLSISTTRYTTARGVFLGDVGITPDVLVKPSRSQDDGDVQLAKAVAVVRSKSAYRPANLVATDQTFIPALGPAPKPTQPPEDVDWQRVAYEHRTWIVQGLAVVAGLALIALFWLLSQTNSGGPGGKGSGGTPSGSSVPAGGRLSSGSKPKWWRGLRRRGVPKGKSPAPVASVELVTAAAAQPIAAKAEEAKGTDAVKAPARMNYLSSASSWCRSLINLRSKRNVEKVKIMTKKRLFSRIMANRWLWGGLFAVGVVVVLGGGLIMAPAFIAGGSATSSGDVLTISSSTADAVNTKVTEALQNGQSVYMLVCDGAICDAETQQLAEAAKGYKGKLVFVRSDSMHLPPALMQQAIEQMGSISFPLHMIEGPEKDGKEQAPTFSTGVMSADEIKANIENTLNSHIVTMSPSNAQDVQATLGVKNVLLVVGMPEMLEAERDGLEAAAVAHKDDLLVVFVDFRHAPGIAKMAAAMDGGAQSYPVHLFFNVNGTKIAVPGLLPSAGIAQLVDAGLKLPAPGADPTAAGPGAAPTPPVPAPPVAALPVPPATGGASGVAAVAAPPTPANAGKFVTTPGGATPAAVAATKKP